MNVSAYAPRVSSRTRLLVAAVLWTAVGSGLLAAGLHWLAASPAWLASVPVAVAAGWLKGRYVLGPRAEANAQRIVAAPEPRCVGGAFSWGSWTLALGMMVGGAALRHSALPRALLGVLYTAVGAAMVVASARSWSHWRGTSR